MMQLLEADRDREKEQDELKSRYIKITEERLEESRKELAEEPEKIFWIDF